MWLIQRVWEVKTSRWTLVLGVALLGCSRVSPEDTVASVGTRVLTRAMVAQRAGVPFDSLSPDAKWELAHGWVEQTLLLLEAQRRGLQKDPEIKRKLDELRFELLRSRLLRDLHGREVPADSAIERYYEVHRSEFVRAQDEYEIELYWAPDQVTAELFRRAALKDIDLAEMAHPNVTMEGIWRASAADLDPDEVAELATLKPGQFGDTRRADEGYRLFRLRDRLPAGQLIPFEEVRHEIRERLMLEASRMAMEALLSELGRKYPVTINLGDSLR